MDRRAVSDVVGFVLVFSLITLIVGTIYLSGLGGLSDARVSERLTNGERAFDVLSENIDDITDTGALTRSTEIKLSNARLHFGDPVTFRVNMTDTNQNYTANVTPLLFTIEDSHVVFVNGAVIRQDPGGSAMLYEPTIVAGDRVLIPLIVTRAQGGGISGSGRVLIRAVESTSHVERYDDPPADGTYDANISVTTTRTRAWQNHLEDTFDTSCSVSAQTVTCGPINPKRIDLQVVKINIRIT